MFDVSALGSGLIWELVIDSYAMTTTCFDKQERTLALIWSSLTPYCIVLFADSKPETHEFLMFPASNFHVLWCIWVTLMLTYDTGHAPDHIWRFNFCPFGLERVSFPYLLTFFFVPTEWSHREFVFFGLVMTFITICGNLSIPSKAYSSVQVQEKSLQRSIFMPNPELEKVSRIFVPSSSSSNSSKELEFSAVRTTRKLHTFHEKNRSRKSWIFHTLFLFLYC